MLSEVRAYFRECYQDPEEASWKALRFMAVMMYYADHVSDFDEGDLSVYGSDRVGALVSEHLLRALHTLIIADSTRLFTRPPQPAEVIALAHRVAGADQTSNFE